MSANKTKEAQPNRPGFLECGSLARKPTVQPGGAVEVVVRVFGCRSMARA